jgi:hypothetical protein
MYSNLIFQFLFSTVLFDGENFMQKMQTTDEDIIWACQYCGVINTVWIDLTIGGKQDFIEDCRICCRPNRLIITNDESNNIFIEARPCDE